MVIESVKIVRLEGFSFTFEIEMENEQIKLLKTILMGKKLGELRTVNDK